MEEPRSYWGVIPGEVFHDKELTAAAKLLYLVLSSMAHKDGYCWPSNETLSSEMNLSKRRVRELLAKLQERGYIQVNIQRSTGRNEVERRYIYCGLFLSKDLPDPPAKICRTSGENLPDPPAKSRIHLIGRKNKLENNISPISPSEVLREFTAYAGDSTELLEALNGFLESRAKRGKPIDTLRAAHILTNKLDKLTGGNLAAKITLLDTATLNGWRSVYPLKAGELPALPDANEEGYDGI